MANSSIWNPALIRPAIRDAIKKLNPRVMVKNPVMFVVEGGSVLTTLAFVQDLAHHNPKEALFSGQITLWLWFTVLFANFAEAMAEGRGKAQAENLRKARTETKAKRRVGGQVGGKIEVVNSSELKKEDVV